MVKEEKRQQTVFCEAKKHVEEILPEEIRKKYGIVLPRDYQEGSGMAKLSAAKKMAQESKFCRLPFDHTVEAEAFGGQIKYNGKMPPYISAYHCHSLNEILALAEVDFTKGRIKEVLNACRQLKADDFSVLLEVSGPFTILNGLLPTEILLRAIRKEPEQFAQAWGKMTTFLLKYLEEITECQVDVISYADPLIGADILGSKRALDFAETFVYPFLKQAEAQLKKQALILLCPKISFSLIEAGVAIFQERNFEHAISYGDAYLQSIGKIQFAGEICSKKENRLLGNGKMKELKLL